MDPMDFTMDDSSNVLAGPALRYQCQQPQSQSNTQTNGPNFASHGSAQARDTQPYDPVHESSAWYQHNHANFTSRPPTFPVTQSLSQWSTVAQTSEPTQHWSHFSEMERRTQDFNPSEYRRSFMPWGNDARGFDGFSHPGYAPPVSTASNGSTEPALQFRPQTTLRGYAVDTQQHQQQYLFSRDMARANIPPHSTTMASHTAPSEHRPPQISGTATSTVEPSSTTPQPTTFAGLRSGFTRAARPNISRHEDILEGSRRRRLAASWDSDDDEESLAEIDRFEVARRHAAAEALFGGDFDDDRSIAALRGAMAGGKRVPSKEALQSLEIVKVAELKDADRTCIICYNEFGVSNPEGEIENPIRLPKCKHIFGDKCIKKWFEDSDSCPYCRDKLPSELAIRKSMGAYQSYRLAHREQLRLAALAQRSRYSSYTPAGVSTVPVDMDNHRSSSAVQRAHDEYDYLLSRQSESWGLSSPNRNPNADSPERRRQARGRHGAIRGPHFLGRPTSVGSARASNPSFTHPSPRNFADLYTPRRTTSSDTAAREARDARDRESRATMLASAVSPFRTSWDQVNSEPSGPTRRTPPSPPIGSAMPHEEASPPVAVGSVSVRRQINQQQNPSVSRLSVGSDNSDFMFDLPSESSTIEELNIDIRNQHATTAIPSFGTLLGVGNNNTTRHGPGSNGEDELARMSRMDTSQVPLGWGSIN